MENTSKALLIAAAILIVIILIAFGMKVLNSSKDVSEDAQGVGESISDASQLAVSKLEASLSSKKWKVSADGETYTSSDGKEYSFGDKISNDEVLAATGGNKRNYTEEWQVIGVENGKLKLISVSNVCEVTLGYNDPNATGSSNYEKAIDSWKKAVTTLNNAAKANTGISTARSLSIEDVEKLAVINKHSDHGKENTYSYGTFVDKQGNIIKATAQNKITIKTNYLQASKNDNKLKNCSCWLTAPCVRIYWYNSNVDYGYYAMFGSNLSMNRIFNATDSSQYYIKTEGVRAIVYI